MDGGIGRKLNYQLNFFGVSDISYHCSPYLSYWPFLQNLSYQKKKPKNYKLLDDPIPTNSSWDYCNDFQKQQNVF